MGTKWKVTRQLEKTSLGAHFKLSNYISYATYDTYKKRRETEEENEFKEKIQSLERSLNESSLDELESFKAQLQDIRDKKVEEMIIIKCQSFQLYILSVDINPA